MSQKIDPQDQIGRRFKLRDLHVFRTVAERNSMAQAAAHLGVSQPAISEVIANLEQAMGVPLLDRGPRGVEPTVYGRVLLRRSSAAFDELKQGVSEIESMADPTAGELRIGCAESITTSLMPDILRSFVRQYPRALIHVEPLVTPTFEMPKLRDRTLDFLLARISDPFTSASEHDDLNVDVVFHDRLVVTAGAHNPLARRRKIEFAELAEQQWVLLPPYTWNTRILERTFKAHGLAMPRATFVCYSFHLRASLLMNGSSLTAFPNSAVKFGHSQYRLKVLPVDLVDDPWPMGIVSLKNRSLSPIAQAFIEHLRAFMPHVATELAAR
jgi:DNA-binding transcriptional LysR family regulator